MAQTTYDNIKAIVLGSQSEFLSMIAYRDEAIRLIKLENNALAKQKIRDFIDNLNKMIKEYVYDVIDEFEGN